MDHLSKVFKHQIVYLESQCEDNFIIYLHWGIRYSWGVGTETVLRLPGLGELLGDRRVLFAEALWWLGQLGMAPVFWGSLFMSALPPVPGDRAEPEAALRPKQEVSCHPSADEICSKSPDQLIFSLSECLPCQTLLMLYVPNTRFYFIFF